MGGKTVRTCDVCELDGEEGVKAVGYYFINKEEFYDVCKRHAKSVRKEGKEVYLYWRHG